MHHFSGKIKKNRTMICGAQFVPKPVTTAVSDIPKFVEHPGPVYLYTFKKISQKVTVIRNEASSKNYTKSSG